jgi:hypothetical protein
LLESSIALDDTIEMTRFSEAVDEEQNPEAPGRALRRTAGAFGRRAHAFIVTSPRVSARASDVMV